MRVLIISPSEICYNPRLLKAADFLHGKGAEVTVFNTVTGLASKEVYKKVCESRDWELLENDITKGTLGGKMRWLYSGVIHKLAKDRFIRNGNGNLFPHVMNKGYVLFPDSLKKRKFDYIIIHLVDSLPFAVQLKKRTGAKLIYDSQEYFKGQYQTAHQYLHKWVNKAEDLFSKEMDIVLATTGVMKERLQKELTGAGCFLRVRNTPVKKNIGIQTTTHETLKIVWHGLSIVPENIRGIHILLQAVAKCKTSVELFLQGNITAANREKMETLLQQLNISNKVHLLEAANPDNIVESLTGYDIGAVGELAAEDNQRLTSSNKLFEFINAGLAILVPDLPGLSETIDEFGVGMKYQQGNSSDLAQKIDALNHDRQQLAAFRNAAFTAGRQELFWEFDYESVWQLMKKGILIK